MKKRSAHLVHEHFEEVFVVPLLGNIIEGERSYLVSRYLCNGLSIVE